MNNNSTYHRITYLSKQLTNTQRQIRTNPASSREVVITNSPVGTPCAQTNTREHQTSLTCQCSLNHQLGKYLDTHLLILFHTSNRICNGQAMFSLVISATHWTQRPHTSRPCIFQLATYQSSPMNTSRSDFLPARWPR